MNRVLITRTALLFVVTTTTLYVGCRSSDRVLGGAGPVIGSAATSHDGAVGTGGQGATAGSSLGGAGSPDGTVGTGGQGAAAGSALGGAGNPDGTAGTGGQGAAAGSGPDGIGCALGCANAIAAGDHHTCTIRTDGTLWCWGDNQYGQLGIDTAQTPQPWPMQVTALGTNVTEVTAGSLHTCARKTDGTLWCWGANSRGQLGVGTFDVGCIPGPAPEAGACKLSPVQVTALGTDVAEVVAGYWHTCARKTDGTLWCWGYNSDGQLGYGTIASTEQGGAPSPVQVTALGTNVAEVAAMQDTCARKADDTLWCWGFNGAGNVGDGTITSLGVPSPVQVTALGTNVAEVAAGNETNCARKTDGTVWCWGYNQYYQFGDVTTESALPVQVTALGTNVTDVVLSKTRHLCARKTDGTLWCLGDNEYGQLGDGTTQSPKLSPVQVTALGTDVTQVAAGGGHTCARTTDGTLWCWGFNDSGQLGDGAIGDLQCSVGCKSSPVAVALPLP